MLKINLDTRAWFLLCLYLGPSTVLLPSSIHREELSVAKMNYNSYIHQANDYRQQIQDNEQEVKVLTVKSENAQAAEAIQDTKVRVLIVDCLNWSRLQLGNKAMSKKSISLN